MPQLALISDHAVSTVCGFGVWNCISWKTVGFISVVHVIVNKQTKFHSQKRFNLTGTNSSGITITAQPWNSVNWMVSKQIMSKQISFIQKGLQRMNKSISRCMGHTAFADHFSTSYHGMKDIECCCMRIYSKSYQSHWWPKNNNAVRIEKKDLTSMCTTVEVETWIDNLGQGHQNKTCYK